MIIDSFSYNGEIEALKVRLYELFDIVDKFIIVESCYTFSGIKKELKFPEQKDSIDEKFLKKIKYIIYDEFDINDDAWERSRKQKNGVYYLGIINLNLKDDDYIIYSDADEIPNSEHIKKLIQDNVSSCQFNPHWFNFNIENYLGRWQHYSIWLFKYEIIKQYIDITNNIRKIPGLRFKNISGWHLSYFVSPEEILNKLKSYEHYKDEKDLFVQEKSIPYIKEKIKEGGELFGASTKRSFEDKLPKYYNDHDSTIS